jgi:hypothetical protein
MDVGAMGRQHAIGSDWNRHNQRVILGASGSLDNPGCASVSGREPLMSLAAHAIPGASWKALPRHS